MGIKQHDREYDIVLFGATGYTGRLTAEHIVTQLPTNLKWAVAGRSEKKLQTIVDGLRSLNPDRSPPSLEVADTGDDESMRSLAKKAYVFLTTVGPYSSYGEHAFKACAETGTHYLDVTGETPWVARMIKKYEAVAKSSGAMMFPQIGVESSPADLMTWALATFVRSKLGKPTEEITISVAIDSVPSGGTLSSVFTLFDNFSLSEIQAPTKPFALSPIPHPETARPSKTLLQTVLGIRHIPNLGLTTTSVAALPDTPIIERTWGLLSQIPSRKDQFYGPKFRWSEVATVRNWLYGVAIHLGLLIGGFLIAFVPLSRTLAKKLVYQPGEGRSSEEYAKESVEYRGIAIPDSSSGDRDKQAFARAWFHGSMYTLTGVFLAQAAMTLLEEDVELEGGVFTPACLGQGFIDRAGEAGFKMELKMLEN